jgi:peroxiredoxin
MRPFVLLCIVWLASGLGPSVLAVSRVVTFSGRVLDAHGRPVNGGTVYVRLHDAPPTAGDRNPPPVLHQTAVGPSGSFHLDVPVRQDRWSAEVIAARQGHGPGGQVVGSQSRATGLVLSLTRPSFVAGRVVDRAGQPIAGATVSVTGAFQPDNEVLLLPAEVRPPATSDAQGRFRIAPLPANFRLSLAAEHPRYARGESFLPVSAGADDATIVLAPPGTIVGRVISEDGKPAANVTAYCMTSRISLPDGTTDANGNFRFTQLSAEKYFLGVVLPGEFPDLVADTQEIVLTDGAEERCPELRLVRGGVATGKVTDESGQPLAGVGIAGQRPYLPADMTAMPGLTTSTAADGTYRLRLPPGTWRVYPEFCPPGYIRDRESSGYPELAVAKGETTQEDFTLRRTVLLRGRVLDAAGKPAMGATVWAGTKRGTAGTQTTDGTGRFTVSDLLLANDAVRLTVSSRDESQGAHVEVKLSRLQGDLMVRLERHPSITGIVMDRRRAPISGALVRAERLAAQSGWRVETATVRITDVYGRFSLPVLPGAQYGVSVEAKRFGGADKPHIRVESGKPLPPLEFVLERADSFIAGVVTDPAGKPLAGANITAIRPGATRGYLLFGTATSDAQGRFRLGNLPPSSLGLATTRPNYDPDVRLNVPIGTRDVRLVLAPQPIPARVGAPAPDFPVVQWVNGTGINHVSELRGKTVVLQFSYAFSGPARPSNSELKTLHAELKAAGRNDVVILAVYEAAAPDNVAGYARAEGLPFPIGIAEEPRALGRQSAAFEAYGIRELPTVFVIDAEGILRSVNPTREELRGLAR